MRCNRLPVIPATVCVGLLLFTGRASHAQTSFNLATLIANQTVITFGDKSFSNWTYTFNGPDMPSASNISVVPQVIAGNIGLNFIDNWHANPGNGNETAAIGYRVSVLTPGVFITDVHLDGDPTVNGGPGQVQVTESVSDIFTHTSVIPRTLSIFDTLTADGVHTTRLNDVLNTNAGYTALDIEKTITASADSATTTAGVAHIQQSFSQTVAAPEPGSLVLMLTAFGLPGTVCLVRRRRG